MRKHKDGLRGNSCGLVAPEKRGIFFVRGVPVSVTIGGVFTGSL